MAHRGRDRADPQDRSSRGSTLRQLLKSYDDVVYRAHPSAAPVVPAAAALPAEGVARVHVRPYPPPTLAAVA